MSVSSSAGDAPVEVETGDPLLWPLSLFAGLLPLLMLGFLTSVIANRLVFLGWALLMGAAYVVVLGRGFAWVWHPLRHFGAVALVYAAGLGSFGRLIGRHQQAFDEGFRALLWDYYRPAVSAPSSWYALAAALALVGVMLALLGWQRERRRPVLIAETPVEAR